MKKIQFALVILVVISGMPMSAPAQFFKKIVNSIHQATSKQVDTTAQGKVMAGMPDTAALMKNPYGSMGNTGPSVSAADSAAAISQFNSSSGGSGHHYTYVTSTSASKGQQIFDTTSEYLTNEGNFRSEVRMSMPNMAMTMIVLGHFAQPRYTVSLFPDDKSYCLNIADSSTSMGSAKVAQGKGSSQGGYQVTVVGTETIQGYSCTHARVSSSTDRDKPMDIWTSTQVPGYSELKKMISVGRMEPGMIMALEQSGASGFIVKIASTQKDYSLNMVLVSAEGGDFQGDLFRIPDGYTQSNENMMVHMMVAAMKNRQASH